MGIKRPLMILGSTVGAVAAVLSYHPATGGTAAPLASAPETPADLPVTPTAAPPTPTPTASASASATPDPTPTQKKKAKSSASSSTSTPTPKPKPSATATPDPTPTSQVAKDQTVTGATAQTRWGPVQVQITVKDGKIVDAVGLQYPNGDRRSQWISDQAIPWLVEETLQEQIADVQIIGGATYTSNGWRQSLASAMQKAGL